jgi:hypothetical protein
MSVGSGFHDPSLTGASINDTVVGFSVAAITCGG